MFNYLLSFSDVNGHPLFLNILLLRNVYADF